MKKIQVKYQEPGGIIWKVLPDEEGQNLIIESRDAERRRTLLAVLSLATEDFRIKEIPAPKPWWIGLKAVAAEKIVLQGYRESKTPEPLGVYVLDIKTGIITWKDEEKTFHSLSENTLLLSAREEDQTVWQLTDLRTGKSLGTPEGEVFGGNENAGTSSVFPLLYSEENIHYKTLAEFIFQSGYSNRVGPIEYLEYEGKLFFSFYIQEGKTFINRLLIMDEEGDVLLEDKLSEGAEGIGMAAFFICNKKLIYIKNKTSIALADIV